MCVVVLPYRKYPFLLLDLRPVHVIMQHGEPRRVLYGF
jgi:hypothetical protein